MAALFQTWPKKWLFYLIKGHVVIQNNNNNNNKRKKKKKRQLVPAANRVFFFLFFFLCQNDGVEKLVGDSCVQYALAL